MEKEKHPGQMLNGCAGNRGTSTTGMMEKLCMNGIVNNYNVLRLFFNYLEVNADVLYMLPVEIRLESQRFWSGATASGNFKRSDNQEGGTGHRIEKIF